MLDRSSVYVNDSFVVCMFLPNAQFGFKLEGSEMPFKLGFLSLMVLHCFIIFLFWGKI